METRTRTETLTFKMPFELDGYDGILPAGDYQVETEEEFSQGSSFAGFRRVLTLLHLQPAPNSPKLRQSLEITPHDLDVVFLRDLACSEPPK